MRLRPDALRTAGTVAAVALVGAMFVLLAWRLATSSHGNRLAASVASGERPAAPRFELPLLAGGTLDLARLRGKPVVLNFWASWCTPCKAEAGRLQAAADRYPDVAVVGIDAQDFMSDAQRFVRRHGVRYANVHDADGTAYAAYGVTGFPETWFVDRDGRLAYPRVAGEISRETLAEAIAALRRR